MPVSPLVAAPMRLPLDGASTGATRWDGVPGRVAVVVLPGPELDGAAYRDWAAAVADQGAVVVVLDQALEPGEATLATIAALVAELRAELPGRLVALAGHGIGGSIVADALERAHPPVDAGILIAPGVPGAGAPRRPSLLGRLLGRSHASASPAAAGTGPPARPVEGQLDVAARVRLDGPPVRLEIGGLDVPDHRRYQHVLPRFPPGEVVIHSTLRAAEIPIGPDARALGEGVAGWLRVRLQDRLRDVGPAAPDWAARPRAEAVAAHEEFVAGEAARLASFLARVARLGGPAPSTEPAALASLGAWLHDAIDDRGPRDADPPRLERRSLSGPLARVSSEGLWLADGAATFLLAALREREPALRWALCTNRRDHNVQRTLLEPAHLLPEGITLWLLERLVTLDPAEEPLVKAWESLLGLARRSVAGPDEPADVLPLDEVAVEAYDGPDWDASIWIPEGAEPALGRARFEALEDQLRALGSVRDVAWEDREVFLLRLAPGTDLARLRRGVLAILRRGLREAEREDDEDDEEEG